MNDSVLDKLNLAIVKKQQIDYFVNFNGEHIILETRRVDLERSYAALFSYSSKIKEMFDKNDYVEKVDFLDSDDSDISNLLDTVNEIQDKVLLTYRCGDKNRIFNNIRALAKKNDVKIGFIESLSGNAAGYMSRLQKEGNKQSPNLALILTAAQVLGVSVNSLMEDDFDDMPSTDKYLITFFNNLKMITKSNTLIWEPIESNYLNICSDQDNSYTGILSDYKQEGRFAFESSYDYKYRMIVNGTSYKTTLENDNGIRKEIYLISCLKEVDDNKGDTSWVIEVYFLDEGKKGNFKTPICTTVYAGLSLKESVHDLYREIELSKRRVQLSEDVQSFIDSFVNSNNNL